MSLLDAIVVAGLFPTVGAIQKEKKRYSERLSQELALEVANSLRNIGFHGIRPLLGGPGKRAFQGGLGPKKVDVSFADEQHGLLMAVSIKSITSAPSART